MNNEANLREQNIKIQKTANTLYDLRDHTDVRYCKGIADFLVERSGGAEGSRISTENFMALVVSRFMTNHRLLELMAKRYGESLQIIELGAGFTPHFLNLNVDVCKYVEVELEVNSKLKEEITKKLTSKDNISFISGDILTEDVWKKLEGSLDPKKPVLIFSEGVVAQYFNAEQKAKIASLSKHLLIAEGSCFVIDDTLRNHPDLHSNPIIVEGMNRIATQSGSGVYNKESSTFEQELDNWRKLFNNTVYTIDYILSKPDMDFALQIFKLIVCANDKNRELEPILLKQSKLNNNERIWK